MSIKTVLFNNKISKLNGLIDSKSLIPETRSIFIENQEGVLIVKTINEYAKSKIAIDYANFDTSMLIEYKKFANLIKKLSSKEIEIQSNDNFIVINAENSVYKFNSLKNEKDFNFSFDENDFTPLGTISGLTFKQALEKVEHAIAEEGNVFLNGVFIKCHDDNIKFLTTDQGRVSYVVEKMNLSEEKEFFISARALEGLIPFIGEQEVEIYFKESDMLIVQGHDYLNISFKEGHFPKVVTEDSVSKVNIKKDEVKKALERLSILADEYNQVEIVCDGERITFTTTSWNNDRFVEECSVNNPNNLNCNTTLKLKHLKEAIKQIDTKECTLHFAEIFMVSSAKDNHKEIILPIKK